VASMARAASEVCNTRNVWLTKEGSAALLWKMHDQTMTLSSGRKLGFDEYGDPRGAPLFYFHGWPSSRSQGKMLDAAGKKHGLRIISPDRPGIGLSDFHPHRQLLDWPPVLMELAAHLGVEKFFVLGVSGGGPYALVTAFALPDRLLGVTVCCGAPPLRVLGTDGLIWSYKLGLWAWRWLPWALGPGFVVSKHLINRQPSQWPLNWLLSTFEPADRQAISDPACFSMISGGGVVALQSGTRAVVTDAEIYLSDWGFDLGSIIFPVRFWHGALDKHIPISFAKRIAAMIPNAITTWKPDDGHFSLPLQHAEEMLEAMIL
jgi:pimeloyl-ACP methyl ester carboxylesterase